MADIPQEVREAAARALGYKSWADATDYRLTGEQDRQRDRMVQALHAMLLAGKRAGMERAAEIAEKWIDEIMATPHENSTYRSIAQAIRSENDGHG